MATRSSPTPSEESSTSTPLKQQSPGTAAPSLKDMFSEITKMSVRLLGVAADITTIKETTNKLKTTVSDIKEQLEEAKGRISGL